MGYPLIPLARVVRYRFRRKKMLGISLKISMSAYTVREPVGTAV